MYHHHRMSRGNAIPQSTRDFLSLPEESKRARILSSSAVSQINKQDAQGTPTSSLYSFEPEVISESEERERITALAQRDFLIKSYGMLEQIYMAMKRNGTLRPADEKKYGLYGRLGHANTSHSTCSSSHSLHHRQTGHLDATQIAADQCQRCSLKGNEVTALPPTENFICSQRDPALSVFVLFKTFYAPYETAIDIQRSMCMCVRERRK